MTRTFLFSAVLAVVVLPVGLRAQSGGGSGARPDGWVLLTDRVGADTTAVRFEEMGSGFHVTTGPSAIFYDPGATATGTYRVGATLHLFDPGDANEAFGFWVGGRDLMGSYQTYTYFLIRGSGEYQIGLRFSPNQGGTETFVDWTAHPALRGWDSKAADEMSVANRLEIEATAEELVFYANGEEVYRMPREVEGVEGVTGIRVREGVDVHVTDFGASAP